MPSARPQTRSYSSRQSAPKPRSSASSSAQHPKPQNTTKQHTSSVPPTQPSPVHPAPAPQIPAQHEIHVKGPGFLSSIAQGLAFGTGSAVAHDIIFLLKLPNVLFTFYEAVHGVVNSFSGNKDDNKEKQTTSDAAPVAPQPATTASTTPAQSNPIPPPYNPGYSESYPQAEYQSNSPYSSGVLPPRPCGLDQYILKKCLMANPRNPDACKQFFEKYNECLLNHQTKDMYA
ncbi:hypothetical protein WA158_005613 [Blastocystis sp. Blastoise]